MLNALLNLLFPHFCVGCGQPGGLICWDCLGGLQRPQQRCYRCEKLSPGGRTCTACSGYTPLQQVNSVAVYGQTAEALVKHLKYRGGKAAAKQMARQMQKASLPKGCLLVPVPTSPDRRRQRGYDQAELIARELAKLGLGIKANLLIRSKAAHQVGLSGDIRRQQLANVFRTTKPYLIGAQPIVLIDDVITTGATFESAARCLAEAGAKNLTALAFAQAGSAANIIAPDHPQQMV